MNDIQFFDNISKKYGFDTFGITKANTNIKTQLALENFINLGHSGDMKWIDETLYRRKNPQNLWPQAKSAIIFAKNYSPKINPLNDLKFKSKSFIASYARRKDYHDYIKGKLKNIASQISKRFDSDVKVFVDTAPIMEKPLANEAGIGWQGKHTNLVSKDYGSWLLLGTILISKVLPKFSKQKDLCGVCNKCIDICPTDAFPEPYKLDARKCISYLTIEYKGHIPKEFRKKIGNRIFGCDDCLAICPWNKFAKISHDIKFIENNEINLMPISDWLSLDEKQFRIITSGMPIKRTGYIRMMRNCLIASGNSNDIKLTPYIMKFLDSENPYLRGASIWALRQLLPNNEFNNIKLKYQLLEKDLNVKDEWCTY